MKPNLARMIELSESVFDMHRDPEQLSVDEAVMHRLRALHPASLSELSEPEGPVAWFLLIPTTKPLMEAFLAGSISESRLFEDTPIGGPYDTIYLCSALVLPERQRQGLAKRMLAESIQAIRQTHPITDLFYWSFSPAGSALAQSVAQSAGLPLHERPKACPCPDHLPLGPSIHS